MVDGEHYELVGDEIAQEFSWHNMRDSNHCRRVRDRIFRAVLALKKRDERTIEKILDAVQEGEDDD